MKKIKSIYLDGAANTPLDKNVLKAMSPYLSKKFMGNSFAINSFGIRAMEAVESSRSTIAQCLKVKPEEVYFTSGATEANNMVIKGLCLEALRTKSKKNKIVISAVEHSSIVSACREMEKLGIEVVTLPAGKNGFPTLSQVKKTVDEKTLLVCIMVVNNETGVLADQLVQCVSRLGKHVGFYTLCDCTQVFTVGGMSVEVGKMFPSVDYFTFSAHKFYGPTGVGCLVARSDVPVFPLVSGGAQEQGKRGGTSNTAGIVGMAAALKKMHEECDYDKLYYTLYMRLMKGLNDLQNQYGMVFKDNITLQRRHFNIVSLQWKNLKEGVSFIDLALSAGLECSAGSACDANSSGISDAKPSHVLVAMGLDTKAINRTIRISFTKYTTSQDIKEIIDRLASLAYWCEENK